MPPKAKSEVSNRALHVDHEFVRAAPFGLPDLSATSQMMRKLLLVIVALLFATVAHLPAMGRVHATALATQGPVSASALHEPPIVGARSSTSLSNSHAGGHSLSVSTTQACAVHCVAVLPPLPAIAAPPGARAPSLLAVSQAIRTDHAFFRPPIGS